jgi:hypothetical protein
MNRMKVKDLAETESFIRFRAKSSGEDLAGSLICFRAKTVSKDLAGSSTAIASFLPRGLPAA